MGSRSNPIIRTRAVKACTKCRAAKIGCDRGKPSCSRCATRGLACTYIEDTPEQRDLRVLGEKELISYHPFNSKVTLLAGSAEHKCGKTTREHSLALSKDQPQTRNRVPKACQRCRQLKVRCDQRTPCGRCVRQKRGNQCIYGPDQALLSRSLNKLASFYTGSHWMTVTENIRAITDIEIHPGLCEAIPVDQMIAPNFPLVSSSKSSFHRKKILLTIPDSNTTDQLIELFFRTVNIVYYILHESTFKAELATHRRNPTATDVDWIALLCAVLSQAYLIQSISEHGYIILIDKKNLTKSSRLLQASQDCLGQTLFMSQPTRTTVQCLCVISISQRLEPFSCYSNESSWTLSGLVLRMAYNVSLRDWKHDLNLGNDEVDGRKLLWAAVVHLELRQSLTSGKPSMLGPEDMYLLQHENALLDNFGVLWLSVLPTLTQILDQKHSLMPETFSYREVTQYENELHLKLRQADELFASGTAADLPAHIALTILIRRARLALHYPIVCVTNGFVHSPRSYWASLECCLGLLAQQRTLDEYQQGLRTENLQWLAEIFKDDFYTAALILCHHLLQRETPIGSVAVSSCYEECPSSKLRTHPKETIMETLRSCREIWARRKRLSFCQSMAYGVLNAVLEKIEETDTKES